VRHGQRLTGAAPLQSQIWNPRRRVTFSDAPMPRRRADDARRRHAGGAAKPLKPALSQRISQIGRSRAVVSQPTSFHIACGIGGELWGFQNAGFNVLGGWDFCPRNTALLRRHFPNANIIGGDVHDDEKAKLLPDDVDLVTVSYQCQPSSTQNYLKHADDTRHRTARCMLSRAISMQPSAILIENVAGFLKIKAEFEHTLLTLRAASYEVNWYVMNSGVYTGSSRPRLFILASRVGSDLLRGLFERNSCTRLRSLGSVCTDVDVALWHPPRPNGTGPNGQHCLCGKDTLYPCIDTKCLQPKSRPGVYKYHRRDVGSLEQCTQPTAQHLLKLLGFPDTWFGENELSCDRCTCKVCNHVRQPQAGRMLGRVWCPSMAEAIGQALSPALRRGHASRVLLAGFDPHAAKPALAVKWREHWEACAKRDKSRPTLEATENECRLYVQRCMRLRASRAGSSDSRASRVNLSESQCRKYIEKTEAATRRSVDTMAPVEHYSLDQVKVADHVTPADRAKISALHETYKSVFNTFLDDTCIWCQARCCSRSFGRIMV
jgi:hypothetical protein